MSERQRTPTRTGTDGSFRVEGVRPTGTARLVVTKPGHERGQTEVDLASEDARSDVVLRLVTAPASNAR